MMIAKQEKDGGAILPPLLRKSLTQNPPLRTPGVTRIAQETKATYRESREIIENLAHKFWCQYNRI